MKWKLGYMYSLKSPAVGQRKSSADFTFTCSYLVLFVFWLFYVIIEWCLPRNADNDFADVIRVPETGVASQVSAIFVYFSLWNYENLTVFLLNCVPLHVIM